MQDVYFDGMQLREDCKRLIQIAFNEFNKNTGNKIDMSEERTETLLSKVDALYRHTKTRVQDCTVSSKTPNDFNFYTSLVAFYPYVKASHTVRQLAPTMPEVLRYQRSFKQTIEAAIDDPEKGFMCCDPSNVQNDISNYISAYRERLRILQT